jgi:hypothetical protein
MGTRQVRDQYRRRVLTELGGQGLESFAPPGHEDEAFPANLQRARERDADAA